jgi:hypothetical protein
MKIAFLIERSPYYKLFGPIIDEALQRGWQVDVWHDYASPRRGLKGYQFPSVDNIPTFANGVPRVRQYESGEQLRQLAATSGVEAIVGLRPKATRFPSGPLETDFKYVMLHSGGPDGFLVGTLPQLASSDLICLYSPFWLKWAAGYFAALGQTQIFDSQYTPRVVFTGFPEMDVLSSIDPKEVRDRWNIPQDQPVVLLLPITLNNQHGSWPRIFAAPNRPLQYLNMLLFRGFEHRSWIKHGWNNGTLTKSIRKFCDRNDAFLLVKGRRKNPIPPVLQAAADRMLYDETDYPPTILEAIAISDVCIHFYSTAVIEAVASGCFSLCIDRPVVDVKGQVPLFARMWRRNDSGHLYNYPGASAWRTIPDVIQDLPDTNLSDFELDARAQSRYVEEFLGYNDGRSSARMLDAIQDLVAREA